MRLWILIMGLALLSGAFWLVKEPARGRNAAGRTPCTGFTVLHAEKGIDCHGDTVRLVKKAGYFAIAHSMH